MTKTGYLFAVTSLVALILASAAPAATLVAQYQFENPANLGQDDSGGANNGIPTTGVSPVAGLKSGTSAAYFNGASNITINLLAGSWLNSPLVFDGADGLGMIECLRQ